MYARKLGCNFYNLQNLESTILWISKICLKQTINKQQKIYLQSIEQVHIIKKPFVEHLVPEFPENFKEAMYINTLTAPLT